MSKDIKAYRLSKIQREIKTDIKGELEHVIAFPNYQVLLIFDTGDFVKWNAKDGSQVYTQASDDKDIKQPFAYDDFHVCYISTVHKRLRLYNHEKKTFENFDSEGGLLPTDKCLPEAERNAEKLEDIYRDGIKLAYLPESQQVVVLEMKSFLNANSNDNVVTVFQRDMKKSHVHQTVFNEPSHKQLQISALNKSDTIAVWGQIFESVQIKFFFWNISKGAEGVKTTFTLSEKCDKGKGVCVLNIFPWDQGQIALFGNYNEGDYPWMKIAPITEPHINYEGDKGVVETTTDLDLFKKKENEEDNAWMFHDILYCDFSQQKVLWERKNAEGSYLDVYHPKFKTVTFSDFEPDGGDEDEDDEDFEDNIVSLYKVVSSDGKYLLGYNPDQEVEEGKPQLIPFEVKSVVSLAASLYNILNKSGIVTKYTKLFAQHVISVLVKA